jgi:hypothetical protein
MSTPIENQTTILADVWMEYRDTGDFDNLIEYGDLGFPLAYAITNGIVKTTGQAEEMIQELWQLFLGTIDIEDTGFDSLDDILNSKMED